MSNKVKEELMQHSRKYPFNNMRIDDHTVLDRIEGRHNCQHCSRSRKFFCYSCYTPVGNLADIIPKVQLPIDIDIIKHKKEIDGKSTAVHAAILASQNVKIYTYPNILDYRTENNDQVVLLYPSAESITVRQLFHTNIKQAERQSELDLPKGYNRSTLLKQKLKEIKCKNAYDSDYSDNDDGDADYRIGFYNDNLPIQKAVFIDSTWNQSKGIYKDDRLKCLKTIVLQNRCSQFWRHQKGSPRWYLATIEAIHQLLVELHVNAWGLNAHYKGLDNLEIDNNFFNSVPITRNGVNNRMEMKSPYNGQYDNLLYFFANMYNLIHKYYDHNELKSYRRPI